MSDISVIKIRINFNNSKILISINQSPIPSFFLQGLYLNVSLFLLPGYQR
nr:MAG TPA: hypothetical protein [Bacteriophage sp.]